MNVEQILYESLGTGRDNGKTIEELAASSRISVSQAQAIIKQLQALGHLLIEDEGKFFMASTLEEWRVYRDDYLIGAAVDLAKRHRMMTSSAARRWPQQWRSLAIFNVTGEAA